MFSFLLNVLFPFTGLFIMILVSLFIIVILSGLLINYIYSFYEDRKLLNDYKVFGFLLNAEFYDFYKSSDTYIPFNLEKVLSISDKDLKEHPEIFYWLFPIKNERYDIISNRLLDKDKNAKKRLTSFHHNSTIPHFNYRINPFSNPQLDDLFLKNIISSTKFALKYFGFDLTKDFKVKKSKDFNKISKNWNEESVFILLRMTRFLSYIHHQRTQKIAISLCNEMLKISNSKTISDIWLFPLAITLSIPGLKSSLDYEVKEISSLPY